MMRKAAVILLLSFATQELVASHGTQKQWHVSDRLLNRALAVSPLDGRDLVETTMLGKPGRLGIPSFTKTHQVLNLRRSLGPEKTKLLDPPTKYKSNSIRRSRSSAHPTPPPATGKQAPRPFGGDKRALLEHCGARFEIVKSPWWLPADNGELGRGAFGVVWRAREKAGPGKKLSEGRRIAIKQQLLDRTRKEDEAAIMAKITEAQTLFTLPLIESSVQQLRREDGNVTTVQYLLLPEVRGFNGTCSLENYVDDVLEFGSGYGTVIQRDRHLTGGELRLVLAQLALALRSLHRNGFVHYDVNPTNVFLDGELDGWPTVPRIRLADFGLAKPLLRGFRSPGRVLWARAGTPGLKAPELLTEGTQNYATFSLDWWSFGVTAVSLALGRRASFEQTSGSALELDKFVEEKLAHAQTRPTAPDAAGVDQDLWSLLVDHLLVKASQRPNSLGSLDDPFWSHPFWSWTDEAGTHTVNWDAVGKEGVGAGLS
jgi:hypothetical protein